MISPEKIPTFTGDLVELQRQVTALRRAANAISEGGSDVHTRFQHLNASYKAPEAGQLLATTQAVQETSGTFAGRLETVAGALETYAVEVAGLIKQLETLRWRAAAFVESVKDDEGPFESWRKDEDKVAEHQAIWDGVNAATAAFQQAEVTCADKITALVDGTQWHINDGSPKQNNPYGFSAEQLAQADSLPWGSPEHHEMLPFGIDYHLEQVGISVWDNAAGSVEGLIDLFSTGEEGGAAREGLFRVIVGAEGYLLDPHGDRKDLSPFMKKLMDDSKPHAKEFGKSFVAWDDWGTNSGKAVGTIIFNGLTLGAGPLGAASKVGSAAGKAGAASRVAGTLAKVGEVLDPIGAAAKTVGVAARTLPRVADLTAGVRAATATAGRTHSFIEFPDGSQLRVEDGQFTPGRKGVPDTTPAPREPAAAARTPSSEAPRRHELVGAGARAPEATGHTGDNLPPNASHDVSSGAGSHDSPSTHSGHAGVGDQHGRRETGAGSPSGGGHGADTPSSGSSAHADATPSADGGDGTGHADDGHGGGEKPGPTPSGPMERGGDAEHQLREGIRSIPKNTMKPKVIEKIVERLGESTSGREIADIISSGHLSQSPGFRDTVSMLGSGRPDQFPRAVDQLRLGDQFYRSGLRHIEFEVKNPAIKADIDVRVTDDAGSSFGYQMKRLNNPKNPFDSIAKPDNLGQLSKSVADHKVMLIDGQGSVAEWEARGIPEELLQVHRGEHPFKSEKGRGILFVLRLDDGTIIIPPGSKVDPGGVL
ncbi:hypothetical protein [Streptomyces chryseus]|uniref:WXG100 family type VII secretion target n=1 Tax=Streptomyces chryseus TaxID=68186 RepID=A0ABQ3DQC0_9ACTN|nr:hypothetical protein [Streptomyces chryseus]GHB10110.1 hypothetical protein GCM10010346_36580 [Streptomyces chryseus]